MANVKRTQAQVIAALEETKGTVFLAAKRLGIGVRTMHRYLKRWPKARDVVTDSRGELVDTSELKLWQAVQNGEPWAIRMVLMTQGRDRGYSPGIQVEHSGKIEAKIEVRVSETVVTTREEAAILLAQMEKERALENQP